MRDVAAPGRLAAGPSPAPSEPALPSAAGVADLALRGPEATAASANPAPVPLTELRSEIARQIANAAPPPPQARPDPTTGPDTARLAGGELRTELELAPPDLGKLRLVLQTGERGLHLQIAVERPESLDAVRRHLEGMHRSLLADGVTLDRLDLAAGGRDWSRGAGDGGSHRAGPGADPPPENPPQPPAANTAPPPRNRAGRLDIRI
ncbi:flagellar hook-length control protein FliK [Jannaschia ovalis]|uniref:Flagellar hook-length control protein FliK n=1 Tax=Jannaschia ovalis TaxID=3038773 RepID=A0ABY8LBE8_9RHOB|nr:flagellar hook-length control protein FliK [Jannaschia sp. GRR-S6-38]WGH77503.1 flagellar hook-length control protein FliK [Jannaschia sp. GRR-S6-38]